MFRLSVTVCWEASRTLNIIQPLGRQDEVNRGVKKRGGAERHCQKDEPTVGREIKTPCMLILASCGALLHVRKGCGAAERGAVEGSDMFAIRAEHRQQKGRSEADGLQTSNSSTQAAAAMFTVGTTRRRRFCGADGVCRIRAHSHLSSAGSKERGNRFQNAEPRRKTDPDLSTGARTSSCGAWPSAKRPRLEEPIDSNRANIHISSHQK